MWSAICVVVACSYAPRREPIGDAQTDDDAAMVVEAGTDATPAERCTAKYGSLGQFDLCSSTETSCTFYVDTNTNTTCNAVCASLGGTCIDSADGDCANMNNPEQCVESHGDQVCICSL